MERHMRLIYLILDYAARTITGEDPAPVPQFDEYTPAQVKYHISLCEQAEYLVPEGRHIHVTGIYRLTWDGHERLDELRQRYV